MNEKEKTGFTRKWDSTSYDSHVTDFMFICPINLNEKFQDFSVCREFITRHWNRVSVQDGNIPKVLAGSSVEVIQNRQANVLSIRFLEYSGLPILKILQKFSETHDELFDLLYWITRPNGKDIDFFGMYTGLRMVSNIQNIQSVYDSINISDLSKFIVDVHFSFGEFRKTDDVLNMVRTKLEDIHNAT